MVRVVVFMQVQFSNPPDSIDPVWKILEMPVAPAVGWQFDFVSEKAELGAVVASEIWWSDKYPRWVFVETEFVRLLGGIEDNLAWLEHNGWSQYDEFTVEKYKEIEGV